MYDSILVSIGLHKIRKQTVFSGTIFADLVFFFIWHQD